MTIYSGEQLTIETLQPEHAAGLIALTDRNRAYLKQWLTWVDYLQTEDDFRKFIAGAQQRMSSGAEVSCVMVHNKIIVGRIGIYYIDRQNRIGSMGYWIGEEWQGRGLVTEACRQMVSYGFRHLKLNRLEIKCGTENLRSQAIPRRLEFYREGVIRQGELLNGRFIDLCLYAMLSSEWKESGY